MPNSASLSCGDRFTDVACELLRGGCSIRFNAPGTSMGATIRNGETIHVHPVSCEEIRRGDILLYRWERGVRAHRVAAIGQGPMFVLRGDAGGDAERVPAEKILGRVIAFERDGRPIRLRGPAALVRRAIRRGATRIVQAFRKSLATR